MKDFIVAMQFLTRLPVPHVDADADGFARSMRWFPAVGLIVGLIVAAAARLGLYVDGWTGALAALIAWVAVTGALHIDGMSDLADARGAAHRDRARFLAVLADPHVGSFGVVAIVLQLLAKLILLHALIEDGHWSALILTPFAARIGPLVWAAWLPPLHPGLAARFASARGRAAVVAWMLVLLASAPLAPAMLCAPLWIILWGYWLKRAVGGVTGDCHGAGIELVETGLLLMPLVITRLM